MSDNPTKHVVIALMLTAAILIIAGDKWNARIAQIHAVQPARKAQ
jgi:hypothetical protein